MSTTWRRAAVTGFSLLWLLGGGGGAHAFQEPSKPAAAAEPEREGWVRLELALIPILTQQQIEGPNRDDRITQEFLISTQLSAMVIAHKYFEAGLLLQIDAGEAERTRFGLVGDDGTAALDQSVSGSFWEFWLAVMVRGRLGPIFLEVGWAPLILREDSIRTDLANTAGETDGLFVGSRAVAWILGVGGAIRLIDKLDLTLRLQFRIRYLVERGGEPLAAEEETGQMTLWPFIGVSYAF